MKNNYSPSRWSGNLSERSKIDIADLNMRYLARWISINVCLEEGYISKEEARELKRNSTEEYRAKIFLIPHLNNFVSQAGDMISKGLENVFEKGLR